MRTKNNFVIGIAMLLLSLSSCEKLEERDHRRNGVVDIEILSHTKGDKIAPSDAVKLEIRFTDDDPILEVGVTLTLWEGDNASLETSLPFEANDAVKIVDFENADVNKNEFLFTEAVDLSSYAGGTCFILYGFAKGTSNVSDGTELSGTYFCIE